MAGSLEMNADFASWYTNCFMEEGPKREMRWKGVLDVAKSANPQTIEVLARLAFDTPTAASGRKSEVLTETYQKLILEISGGDTSFEPAKSARELQVLAASVLCQLFATSPDAALVVTTSSVGGHRKPDLPMDLFGAAGSALATLSTRKHARTTIEQLKLQAPKLDQVVPPEMATSMDPGMWKTQLEKLRDATSVSLSRLVSRQNSVVEALHKQIVINEEELQMLWWLFGGFSYHLGVPFSEIDPTKKPLILARELVEMTTISPGPSSIRSILARANIGLEMVKISEMVNAVEIEWAKSSSGSKAISPVTTPIHFALEQRVEMNSNEAWQAAWASLTGLSAEITLPALTVAELFYREHLFLSVDA